MTAVHPVRHRLPEHLAQDLKAAHLVSGLTLREAARRVGIGRSHLWRLLHGHRAPSTGVTERLIAVYGIDAALAARLREAAVPRVERHPTRNTLISDIATALKEAREQSGMSFREAARRIGIRHGYLCDITHGRAAPSRTVAERIARVLELEPDLEEALLDAAVRRPTTPPG